MLNIVVTKVIVERSDGQKCPRCWKYNGIPELPQGICDACAQALLNSEPSDFFFHFKPEEEDAQQQFAVDFVELQKAIRESYRSQARKYLAKDER